MFPAFKPVVNEDLMSDIAFCWGDNNSKDVWRNPDYRWNYNLFGKTLPSHMCDELDQTGQVGGQFGIVNHLWIDWFPMYFSPSLAKVRSIGRKLRSVRLICLIGFYKSFPLLLYFVALIHIRFDIISQQPFIGLRFVVI